MTTEVLCTFAKLFGNQELEICEEHWDYRNPDADWPEVDCKEGRQQSPINIDTLRAKKVKKILKRSGLRFSPGYRVVETIQANFSVVHTLKRPALTGFTSKTRPQT